MDFDKIKPTGADLKEARRSARLTPDEAAKQCGIHRTTYGRQEAGQARVSVAAYRLLILLGGYIHSDEWQGWRMVRGSLWSPEDIEHKPGDLYQMHWLHQSIRFLRAELNELTGKEYDQEWFHGYRFQGYEEQTKKIG